MKNIIAYIFGPQGLDKREVRLDEDWMITTYQNYWQQNGNSF